VLNPTTQGGRNPADGFQKVLVVLIIVSFDERFMMRNAIPKLLEIRKTFMKYLP
jgi:hypothetical protein